MKMTVDELTPNVAAREVREIAALGDRGKWPVTVTADEALLKIRENLHELGDQLEEASQWSKKELRLMNLREAASYYRISEDQLKTLAGSGWNKAVAVGQRWRFRR